MVENAGPVFQDLHEGLASLDFFRDYYGVAGVDSASHAAGAVASYGSVGADAVELGSFACAAYSSGEGEVVVDVAIRLLHNGVLLINCT